MARIHSSEISYMLGEKRMDLRRWDGRDVDWHGGETQGGAMD
jgi:hypothetical protein